MITFSKKGIRLSQDYNPIDLDTQTSLLSAKEAEDETYLSDLLMLAEGDIILSRKDYKVSAGILNFAQAITHRIMTTKGRHPRDRTLGVSWDKYMGKSYASKEMIIAEIATEVEEELYRDFRTSQVTYVNVEFINHNAIAIEVGVIPIDAYDEVVITLEANES